MTAVQMISAYNAIANGGVYVPPRLVEGTIDSQGTEHVLPAGPTRRVVSTTVANEMTTMLDEVVRVGTGQAANLDPYTVAGKTGTGLVPLNGHYDAGHYVASFAGFVPAESPQITAMVVIDNTPYFAAAAAAPTFASIARDALQELKIPPLPKEPPAPGVPLSTTGAATGAGDVAGTPLPTIVTSPTGPTTTIPAAGSRAGTGSVGARSTAGSRSGQSATTTATTAPRTGPTPTTVAARGIPPASPSPSPPATLAADPSTTGPSRSRSSPTTG